MEKVVWKYPLRVQEHQTVTMPTGSTPLALQMQEGMPTLWAFVDPEALLETRNVYMLGTGHGSLEEPDNYKHLGTVQIDGFVWHYFMPF